MITKKESDTEKAYTEEELEYINKLMSHGMDRIRAEWYLHAGKTWTREDYKQYDKFHIEMFWVQDERGYVAR